jgi:hypothetical protein
MEMNDRVKKDSLDDEKKKYRLSEVDTRTSHIDEKLHSREKEGFLSWRGRKDLSPERIAVNQDWQHEPLNTVASGARIPVLSTVAFIVSLLMLGGAAFFGWTILNNKPVVQAASATLELSGKKTIASGETLELQVVVKNALAVPLELAELVITYPKGVVSAEDLTKPITNERLPLGTIAASSVRRGTVRSVLFGTSGEDKTIHIALEYRVQGGSVIYQSLADHAVTIGSSAFAISVDGPKEVISGQTNDITVHVTSQSKTLSSDVLAEIEYPFGFTLKESSPEQTSGSAEGARADTHIWALGDFVPGERKQIYLRGVFSGEEGDVRLFKITTGTRTDKNATGIDVPLASADHAAKVKKPFLYTQLLLNGKKPDAFSFKAGEQVKVTLEWKNTLKVPLTNVSLGVLVGGDALKKTGIKVSRGFYRSTDSAVLWDAQTKPDVLKTVAPGASGTEEFQMQTLDDAALEGVANPTVTFGVRAQGKREGEQGVPETVEAVATYAVPVASKATFAAEAKYFTSPFPQSGPLPPKVDTETVYAIEWHVASASSDIANAVVTATLPPNVRYRNIRAPISENLVYDDKTRTVTWYAGSIAKSNSTADKSGKIITFAVGLVPSASQVGENPDIINKT